MGFTIDQISAMEITERVCSILSLLGAAFVIGTFMFDKSFHRPINRLVFYASWGNVMANIGTLISVSGIHLGIDGPLCQFQAFLVQWYVGVAFGTWDCTLTSIRKVRDCRCVMDLRHGIQRVPHLLPEIRRAPAPVARTEIPALLLRPTIHSCTGLLLHQI
jgi:hypothetical protein